jgi:hypothetical protein
MPNSRYETQLFQEQLEDIRRSDKNAAQRIDKVLDRIVQTPQLNDGQLRGPRSGKFKKKAVDQKYRIVFSYCQFCIKTKKERCECCKQRPDDSVILEEVFPRSEGYD